MNPMGFQFAHIENYSRKGDKSGRSVSFVLAEARRDPDASHHVGSPRRPDLIWGCDLDELERRHDEMASDARAIRKGLKGETTRAIRKDQHTLSTVVVSHPYTVEEVEADPDKRAEVERWEALNLAWLKSQYGDALASVVRHTDEKHWHLHAYALPSDPSMKASALHPGQVAKAVVMDGAKKGDKERNRAGDRAYRKAMRAFQDGYFKAVGIDAGLTRLGPGRSRMSRAEWQAHQVQACAVVVAEKKAVRIVQRTNDQKDAYVQQVKAEVAEIRRAAEAQAEEAKAAHDRAVRVERQARAIMKRAKAEASRILADVAPLRTLGGRLRSLWDGLRASSIEKRVRNDVAGELEEARCAVLVEKAARRDAERRASVAESSVKDLTFSGSLASREVSRLSARISAESAPDVENECSRKLVEWGPGGRHEG